MNKNVIITLSSLVALWIGVTNALAESAKIGWSPDPYPPFVELDAADNWKGWEVEFAQAVCKEAKLDCSVVTVTWEGIIPALTSKKIDLIIGSMSITPERMKTIDFTDKYYNTATGVIGRKEDKFAATPEGLAGKIIGVQVSTVHEAYASKHFTKAAEIKIYQTQDEAYQDLAAGRIDAVQADGVTLDTYLKSEAGACCELKGYVAEDAEVLGPGVGIGIRKGEPALKEKLNAAIKSIRANGTYAAITKKYFHFDIYGK
ncbi:MAG: transporter substrate-binding domain-containing protein [Mesorhizobium sp.]|nr:MAG: transporter substrate-binding domain-containing protein [Mesorhizobium sp.]